MMAFVDEHVTSVRRGRSALDHGRLADGFDRAIEMDELQLRGCEVIENLLVFWILEKILISCAGGDAPEVLLDDRAVGNFTALGGRVSSRQHSLADKAGVVAGPFAGSAENAIEGEPGHPVSLERGDVDDPQTEARVGGIVAGVDEGNVARIGRPSDKTNLGVRGQS